MISRFRSIAVAAVLFAALLDRSGVSAQKRADSKVAHATIRNFAQTDVLVGNDGMPPHPSAPFKYGVPTVHVDLDGNMIEEHAATLAHFDGRYYLYGEKWGCGKIVFFSGRIPGAAKAPTYPPGDYGGECGIAGYSSTDLTHWRRETLYAPSNVEGSPSKPQIVWSPGLRKYVLWFKAGGNFAKTGALYYALSDRPGGPWGPANVATGDHLAHDFDIAVGPDGVGYIVTDSFSGQFDKDSPGGSKPLWDVWVQRLNTNMTGTVETPDSKVLVMRAADFEAVGFFEHGGNWYITGGPTCGNCQVPIGYVRASSVLGTWRNEAGQTGDALRDGTVIAADGCTGQNKGADMLPSAAGPVVLSAVWGYRSGPGNFARGGQLVHGDNSQAISSTYWFPVSFTKDGAIAKFTCPAMVRVPLARGVATPPDVPRPYQPDCRIRAGAIAEQRFTGWTSKSNAVSVALFQRTDDKGPFDQGGPIVDAPLEAELIFMDGRHTVRKIAPSDVSWAPEMMRLSFDNQSPLQSVTLRSAATNGCYGVLVSPQSGAGAGYSVTSSGSKDVRSLNAQLLFR